MTLEIALQCSSSNSFTIRKLGDLFLHADFTCLNNMKLAKFFVLFEHIDRSVVVYIAISNEGVRALDNLVAWFTKLSSPQAR
jgi:hypothetical protein